MGLPVRVFSSNFRRTLIDFVQKIHKSMNVKLDKRSMGCKSMRHVLVFLYLHIITISHKYSIKLR